MNTAVEGEIIVESANSLVRASMVMKAGIDRLATFGRKLRAGLAVLSGPTIYPSSSLRPDESPFQEDIDDANYGLLRTLRISPKWALLSAIGGTGFLAACAQTTTDVNIPAIVEKAKPDATATINLTPGIGGEGPVPTFPAGDPRESENPAIEAANKRDAAARAKATSEAQKPTPTPTAIQKPDLANDPNLENRELIEYNIFSLESRPTTQVKREYLEWKGPKGGPIKGMGWELKPGDNVKIRGDLKLSVKILEQPYVYNGVMVLAKTADGSKSYLFLGNFDQAKLKEGILTIAADGQPVFNGEAYTFAYATETEAELRDSFQEARGLPRVVNNPVPANQARNPNISYDVPPPK